jgi:enoyl-CoA hydratase
MAEPEALEAAVHELAERLASNAPLTLRATKEAMRRIALHRRVGAAAADDLVAACYASADFHEGVDAFLAKRAPRFTGR